MQSRKMHLKVDLDILNVRVKYRLVVGYVDT